MARKKMNKIEDSTIKKMAVYLIVVAVFFISIVLIFVIYLGITSKSNIEYDRDSIYVNNVTNRNYEELTLTSEPILLNEKCSEECYIKSVINNNMYYFFITSDEEDYMMTIYDDQGEVDDVYLGTNLETLKVSNYLNNAAFELIYTDGVETSDMLILFDGINLDTINSLGTNEIELTEAGIIYYSYACYKDEETNALKHKNIRMPFTYNPTILEQTSINHDRC